MIFHIAASQRSKPLEGGVFPAPRQMGLKPDVGLVYTELMHPCVSSPDKKFVMEIRSIEQLIDLQRMAGWAPITIYPRLVEDATPMLYIHDQWHDISKGARQLNKGDTLNIEFTLQMEIV